MNFVIRLGIYPFDVMVSVGESNEVLLKELKKHVMSESDLELYGYGSDYCHARTCRFNSGALLIRLRKNPKITKEHGILAHEIFHAAEFLFDHIGVTHSIGCGEVYAYLIGYLTDKIYEKL